MVFKEKYFRDSGFLKFFSFNSYDLRSLENNYLILDYLVVPTYVKLQDNVLADVFFTGLFFLHHAPERS